MVISPRGGLWTLSTRAWFAIFAVAISALGAWVGVSATQAPVVVSADESGASSPVSGASPQSEPNPPGEGTSGTGDQVAPLSIAEPPLLGKTATEVLALLVVRAPDLGADYQRTQQFGEAWLDVDANGCNTREDILLRDLSDAVVNECKVMSGTVADPYSGRAIEFVRGNDTSMLVQIDHIVSLYDSWITGAQQLSQDQRQRLANDPTNLIAVSEETNQSKGAEDAATWLPPFAAMHCEYAARQVSVKFAYDLWVTPAEHDALAAVLRNCPDQPAYRSWLGAPTTALGFAPAPGQTESAVDDGPVYYENCSAAYAAGVSNIPQGAAGYRPELDGHSDGMACEG